MRAGRHWIVVMARRSGRRDTEGVKDLRTEAEGGSDGEESDDDAPEEVSMKAGREAHERQKQAEKSAREAYVGMKYHVVQRHD